MKSNVFKTDNGEIAQEYNGAISFPIDGERELTVICQEMTAESFKPETSVAEIQEYLNHYGRFLYSVISKYIFTLSTEKEGLFVTNLDALDVYIREHHDSIDEDIKLGIIKFWDHVHLALYQCDNLRQGEEEFRSQFKKNIPLIKDDVYDDLREFKSSMITQLIALIGIFTAMAFLVFGGMNSLDNIFDGVRNFPVVVLSMIGSLWGMVMINLIFVFMAFVSKLTDKPLVSKSGDGINVIKMVKLINAVIGFILCISVWVYIIQYLGAANMLKNLYAVHPIKVVFISAAVIVVGFIVILLKIFFNTDMMNDDISNYVCRNS